MPNNELEKLAEQQESLLAEVAAIKEQLKASDWRRKCLWTLASITQTADKLQKRYPGIEQSFGCILEPLDCYVNLTFESAQDLHTLYTCLILIAGILADIERADELTFLDPWQPIRPLMDDLETLESGDPPSLSSSQKLLRSYRDDWQDAERAAVRERFEQRSRARIQEIFARREIHTD